MFKSILTVERLIISELIKEFGDITMKDITPNHIFELDKFDYPMSYQKPLLEMEKLGIIVDGIFDVDMLVHNMSNYQLNLKISEMFNSIKIKRESIYCKIVTLLSFYGIKNETLLYKDYEPYFKLNGMSWVNDIYPIVRKDFNVGNKKGFNFTELNRDVDQDFHNTLIELTSEIPKEVKLKAFTEEHYGVKFRKSDLIDAIFDFTNEKYGKSETLFFTELSDYLDANYHDRCYIIGGATNVFNIFDLDKNTQLVEQKTNKGFTKVWSKEVKVDDDKYKLYELENKNKTIEQKMNDIKTTMVSLNHMILHSISVFKCLTSKDLFDLFSETKKGVILGEIRSLTKEGKIKADRNGKWGLV